MIQARLIGCLEKTVQMRHDSSYIEIFVVAIWHDHRHNPMHDYIHGHMHNQSIICKIICMIK